LIDLLKFIEQDPQNEMVRHRRIINMIKESQNIIHQPIKHPLFLNKQFSTVKNDSIPKDTSGFAGIKNLTQSFDSQDKSYISSDLLFRESQI